MMQLDELIETAELAAFARTVDVGSLSRAARELGVPRATVGRRLARLEQKLGARLIRRTTRKLTLTPEGRALYEQAKVALAAVRDVALVVRQSDGAIRGHLRVSAPPFPDGSFDALVVEFLRAHPDVTIDVHFSTATVPVGEDGYDLAIRASSALDPGLMRRTLATARLVAVASPAYLASRGTPRRAQDLVRHACLAGYDRGQSAAREWPLLRGGRVSVSGPMTSNDMRMLVDGARGGLGITLVPEILARPYLAAGELVVVLERLVGAVSQVAVVYPERTLVRPVVRAFVDAVVVWGKDALPRVDAKCAAAVAPTP